MGEPELEIVFDHFHARRRHDLQAVAATLDPAVVHQGVESELVCNGRDAVLELVGRSFTRQQAGVDSIELTAAGDRVIVRLSGAQFRDNPLLESELFMVFTVERGVITRIDDYRTRDEALRATQMSARG